MADQGPPMDAVSNAGYVRPIEGLGHRAEWIDCPWCQRRVQTRIDQVPTQATQYARPCFFPSTPPPVDILNRVASVLCGLASSPFCCCLTCPIQKKRKWYFNTEHRCSNCNEFIVSVKHNQEQRSAAPVPSQHAK